MRDWRMTFLPQFRDCVKAGSYGLMCSYNRYLDQHLFIELLRTHKKHYLSFFSSFFYMILYYITFYNLIGYAEFWNYKKYRAEKK